MTGHDRLATQVYTAFTSADYTAIDRLFADDYVEHSEFPGTTQDKEGVKQFVRIFHEAFSELQFTAEETLTIGSTVVVRFRLTGRNTGSLMGMPATGRTVDVRGIDMARVSANGRITEHWGYFEETKLMQQLGAVPEQRSVDVTEAKTRA